MARFYFTFVLFFFFSISSVISSSVKRKPIVIVPGVMGSQLEARLHKSKTGHIYCTKNDNKWYRIWLNLDDLLPFSQNCFQDNIKLHYNSTTDQYFNTKGVDIRPFQFGNTTGIENLDPTLKGEADYFKLFIEKLVQMGGYYRGVNIRGAPYDWRLGPAQLLSTQYYAQLKSLIEETCKTQNNTKVILIVHSLGGPVSHYFLTSYVNQSWKDTYIDQYIALGGVWGGTAKIIHALISGDSDKIFKFSPRLNIRPIERSFPSDYWMLPVPEAWNKSTLFVTTPTNNYTAYNIGKLIRDLNYENGDLMYEGVVKSRPHPLISPNVTTHCIYGYGLQTEQSFHFKESKSFPNKKPDIEYGNGDGTVGVASLGVCSQWAGSGVRSVKVYQLKSVEHFDMLNNKNVLDIVHNLVI